MVTFYKCNTCGNQIVKIVDGGGNLTCCNKAISELIPGSTDGALEKHVPVLISDKVCECVCDAEKNCDTNEAIHLVQIQVGSEMHPATDTHHIEWIAIETDKSFQIKSINPGDEPTVDFCIKDCEKINSIFAFCNLHGLWEGTVG